MRTSFTILAIVFTLAASWLLPVHAQEATDDELIGEWEIVEMVFKGKDQDFGPVPRDKFVIGKNSLNRVPIENMERGSGVAIMLRPKATPKEIDVEIGGDTPLMGIYEVKGDTLRLIYQERAAPKRPTDFEAKNDKNLTYYLCRRRAK